MTLLANMIELIAECCVLGFLGISCVTFGAGAQLISMCKGDVSPPAPPQGSSPWRPCSWHTPASSTWASTLSASAATRRRGRRWQSQQGPPSSGDSQCTSSQPPEWLHSIRVKPSNIKNEIEIKFINQSRLIEQKQKLCAPLDQFTWIFTARSAEVEPPRTWLKVR